MVAWIQSHAVLLMGFAVAILDFVFAISPGLRSNGIVHAIYLFLGGKDTPSA